MRKISEVMDAIINVIPNDFVGLEPLKISFESIRTSAMYAAPETMYLCWQRMGQALEEMMPDPADNPWVQDVINIMRGRE